VSARIPVASSSRDDPPAGLSDGYGRFLIPHALARKYPKYSAEWRWQWVFPQAIRWKNPNTGEQTTGVLADFEPGFLQPLDYTLDEVFDFEVAGDEFTCPRFEVGAEPAQFSDKSLCFRLPSELTERCRA
jgi:hypothetical protein